MFKVEVRIARLTRYIYNLRARIDGKGDINIGISCV